jgi:hypothetical protein
MKKSIRLSSVFFIFSTGLILLALSAHIASSDDQIIRQYESVRDMGMGGLKITTGLYDDNFFGNPARAAANPSWRVTILDPSLEVDSHLVQNVTAFTGGGDEIQKVANTAGDNNHARLETTMPAWYLPPSNHRRWSLNAAVITSSQLDLSVRNNYSISDDAFIDVGPAITYAYQFLKDRSLSVGVTGHLTYRLSTNQPYTIADLLNGRSFALSQIGAQGSLIDFDLGMTKIFPWHPAGVELSAGASVDNVLGGKYNHNFFTPVKGVGEDPQQANRIFGLGVSAKKDFAYFHDTMVGFESSDIGNNTGASFYRTLHIGAETRVAYVLRPRVGINEGYLAAGLGVDLRLIEIEAATWGEELSLNPGQLQDRRYGVKVALQL